MPAWVVDGEDWIKKRLTFLRERLAEGGLTDDEQRAVESEIEALSKERGIMPGGLRLPQLWRWLRRNR